jgi:hypothetical protein
MRPANGDDRSAAAPRVSSNSGVRRECNTLDKAACPLQQAVCSISAAVRAPADSTKTRADAHLAEGVRHVAQGPAPPLASPSRPRGVVCMCVPCVMCAPVQGEGV